MTIQLILVPVDFSEYSDRAMDYAIDLASKLDARITLLHVFHEIPLGAGDMASALPYTYVKEIEDEVQQRMEEQLDVVQKAGLKGDVVVMHGVPFQIIIDVAQDRKADLIVMGTHGRTGLPHVLLGSVAEKVARLAPCPVLVARPKTHAVDAAATAA